MVDPRRNSTYKRPFTWEGNYLVYLLMCQQRNCWLDFSLLMVWLRRRSLCSKVWKSKFINFFSFSIPFLFFYQGVACSFFQWLSYLQMGHSLQFLSLLLRVLQFLLGWFQQNCLLPRVFCHSTIYVVTSSYFKFKFI